MSGQKTVTPSATSLAEAVKATNSRGLPPVEQWNPPFCGDLDMEIHRDGTWFYEGTPIGRPALVKLFASILIREGEDYFLVTPVEKVGIRVDDAPFVAVDFEVTGSGQDQQLTFTTNLDDVATADNDFPLRFERDTATGEPSPYVRIRRNLEALIDRKSFYRLVDLGVHHDGWFGVWSGGRFFGIIPSKDLP
ncbi:DUF1285 domain-containing protein [Sulfitobacter donghicola]|uniref:Proteophosphoglycan n=1 Tax=Sulfitobacter donghicola DSW-25 = KCTC 12864 = JCM 14565 TaxID=1300350 RepID=A0A073IJK2_9RHOB|nr:DUF1285 domain-containing protein [Sulfitobacter donghicola]KEJ90488.1 hypothetical protein DSW25_00805 [Sulfitobacter donghicola DSW-25 = KCTC 12864 = JCM 14565]